MGPLDHNSETPLIELFAAYQQAKSFEEGNAVSERIFTIIYSPLSLFITARRVGPNEVSEVLQEALIGIFKGIPVFRGKTEREAWGFCNRIAFNKSMNSIRKQANAVESVPDDFFWEALEASAADRPLLAGERRNLEQVIDLLRVSKPPCVDYLEMHYIEGRSYEYIGDIFDKTAAAAGKFARDCLERAKLLVAKLKSAGKLH